MMFKTAPAIPYDTGKVSFDNDELKRQEHAITMHGELFYGVLTHRGAHRRNDEAIRTLKNEPNGWLSTIRGIENVTLVRHSHAEDDY